jgi:hypothetical protein
MTPVPATAMGHVDDTTRRPHGGERARASIACVHCRKSKTKCNNKGPGTRCDACSEKNKVCDYSNTDAATTTPIVKRRESALGDVDVSTCWSGNFVSPFVYSHLQGSFSFALGPAC